MAQIQQEIRAVSTSRGKAALWEKGGMTPEGKGYAQILANSIGKPLSPIFIKSKGSIENQEHALFPVNEGFYIINVVKLEYDLTVEIKSIQTITDGVDECPFNETPSLNSPGFQCKMCGAIYIPHNEEYAEGLRWTSIHPTGFVSNKKLLVEVTNKFKNDKWDLKPESYLLPALRAAISKAFCLNCRESHYMIHHN